MNKYSNGSIFFLTLNCTGWTNRNATMLQGNHSAGNLYLLSGFMVPQASARSRFGQISVLCSLLVGWVYEFSFMSYSKEQCIFVCNTVMKNLRGESVAESSDVNFPILLVPDKTTIYRLVKIINETCSVQNKKPQVNKRALTVEKLDEIGFQLEKIPQ